MKDSKNSIVHRFENSRTLFKKKPINLNNLQFFSFILKYIKIIQMLKNRNFVNQSIFF